MRISSALLLGLSLTSCGGGSGDSEETASAERVSCAVGDATDFTRVCTLDRSMTDDGLVLTIHHPDGGFHRLRVTTDGRGVVPADGATNADIRIIGDHQIEVAMPDARYRLPATIGDVSES
ncbi:hypothetical protein [Stakelama saccharophila]|uniref:Lipoprotein n=1 Tax=Stakelama saccharophila TaxID=3075605 RepID=A0ABZ0B515_9SPHN|nr:hypothetical protein [Stakelama sp. W311]WNO52476.1 hypothetical protein RPR59_08280 [Stakelama sp. W311]